MDPSPENPFEKREPVIPDHRDVFKTPSTVGRRARRGAGAGAGGAGVGTPGSGVATHPHPTTAETPGDSVSEEHSTFSTGEPLGATPEAPPRDPSSFESGHADRGHPGPEPDGPEGPIHDPSGPETVTRAQRATVHRSPVIRPRRLRHTGSLRRLVAETRLRVDDVVAPLFVREGIDEPREIESLPGVYQHTVDSLVREAESLISKGVPALLLFGVPQNKDPEGSGAWDSEGIVQVALERLRREFNDDVVLMADLCLDEYTDHGHCGVLDERGGVDNDSTLELYQRVAVAQAEAGAHVCAPSGMMDGQVAAIRAALDTEGWTQVSILAYSAKYASGLYGPFRDAVDVCIADGGDRSAYQQDHRNLSESLREIQLDLDEGADMVMVKPAVTYLDVIAAARKVVNVPLAAYHVSGEYSMIHAAAQRGWIDLEAVALEQLTAVKRAGADFICTYFAPLVADLAQAQ